MNKIDCFVLICSYFSFSSIWFNIPNIIKLLSIKRMEAIKHYNCQVKFMDVLQETRRCKIEQVTRFCHKLIRYVSDFIKIEDLKMTECIKWWWWNQLKNRKSAKYSKSLMLVVTRKTQILTIIVMNPTDQLCCYKT